MTDLYTSQTISGYNPDAPPDDGSAVASNLATYDQIKTELVDPVKTLTEAINTQVNTSFETVATAFEAWGTDKVSLGNGTLESWASDYTVQQIGGNSSIYSRTAAGSGGDINFAHNAYWDSANHKYQDTDEASRYYQADGKHIWQVAASGTADTAISWTTALTLNNDGSANFPLQPMVSVYSNASQLNISPGGAVTVNFDTEIADVGSNFNTGTYTFTAPVTGYYLVDVSLWLNQVDTGATNYIVTIVTSNRSYTFTYIPGVLSADHTYQYNDSLIADMDANDTLSVTVTQTAGATQTDITSGQETTRLMITLSS